jgi:1,5-anhydro-D-fructose reductase (1,5-anhydro-D-mannitol-forming)
MTRDLIRWGILGCGDVCEVKSGPAFQKAEGSALVAVMRRDAVKAADFAARHGVPFSTGDADELIHHPEVDAVYIATPPGSHLELARKVAAAGKPCYVEKPVARSAAESRALLGAFQDAQVVTDAPVPLYVGFYRRGLERFQTAKRLMEAGRIGTLTGITYRYAGDKSREADPQNLPWRLKAENAGAGLFYDLGSHLLDIFDFLFGPLENVHGLARNVASPHLDVEDSVAMSFEAAGAPGIASWNFAASHHFDLIEIEGDAGRIALSCLGAEPVRLTTATGTEEFNGALPPHVHQGLVQTIVDELRGRGRALSTGETALRTMEVMDTVLNAYYGGREDEFWTRPQSWPGKRKGL